MVIRELVQSRLKSNFKIFNREGNQVEPSRIEKEYKAIRQYLLDHHSKANDCIAIKQKKDYLYFLTILACQEIGITYIPMKHDYPMDRVAQIQKDSNFSLLISDEEMAKILNYKDQIVTDLPQISNETNER